MLQRFVAAVGAARSERRSARVGKIVRAARAVVESVESRMMLSVSPFGGTAVAVTPTGATTIQAENFNEGGASSGPGFTGGYHDTDLGNIFGSSYRAGTDVDIFDAAAAQNGHGVGWVKQGEFLNFSVNVQQTGDYALALRGAAVGPGGSFSMNLDNAVSVGTVMAVPDTGGWTTFQDVGGGTVHLTAGTHTLTLFASSAVQANGYMANIDSFTLTAGSPGGTSGVTIAPSGTTFINAANFDAGGEGAAYHDTDAGNVFGSSFRAGTDVDIFDSASAVSGHAIGWVKAGEYLKYTINAPVAGSYHLAVSAASVGAGGTFQILLDGATVSSFDAPDTAGWLSFQTVPGGLIDLSAGTHVLTLQAVASAQSNGYMANIDRISISA